MTCCMNIKQIGIISLSKYAKKKCRTSFINKKKLLFSNINTRADLKELKLFK